MPSPLPLARLDTPLEPLLRASARLGAEIWVKRDDLTGCALSGNKVRKLEYLLAEARAAGARTVITCGAVQSNHARATALAARRVGLEPVLLLRGALPAVPAGNLLLDALAGARVETVDEAGYADRADRMAALARTYAPAYIIPEGGSNAVGALGYLRAGRELEGQARARGVRFDAVLVATGSGGTLAGLAAARLPARVFGVAVCDDRAHFRARVAAIGAEMAEKGLGSLDPPGEGWEVLEGFQGRGYGLSRPEELREAALLCREEGLVLDPVYTGKAWFALAESLRADPTALGRRVLFWHTGGIFGLFGREAELVAATAPTLPPPKAER
jgi:D-cysteine desulfhydrase